MMADLKVTLGLSPIQGICSLVILKVLSKIFNCLWCQLHDRQNSYNIMLMPRPKEYVSFWPIAEYTKAD